ncbi:flagellar protein FlaG [Undibacterium sp. TJN25]|uniref:flagellar protein FlaG n=1 Tax=Undibacterium sp. TJN25 TaxID=3413056 RepID=UPI003BF38880
MDISSTGGAGSVAARVANLGLYGADSSAPAVSVKAAAEPAVADTNIQQPSPVPSTAQVNEAVKSINTMLQSSFSQDLEFSFDSDADRAIVKVVDQKTGDVIRQMPSKEALEISKALDKLQGLLIKQKA